MKNAWVGVVLAAFQAGTAAAAPVVTNRVLRDATTVTAIELTDKTVFCTDRGYGNVQLKVSVPDLDWLAHLDHRVVGERLPCITGGACSGENGPGDIIDPANSIEIVPVRVVLTERLSIDADARTCARMLVEEVRSVIRGRRFDHFRNGPSETLDIEKCAKLARLP